MALGVNTAPALVDLGTAVPVATNTLCVLESTGTVGQYTLRPTVVTVNPTTGAFSGGTFPAAGDVDGPSSSTASGIATFADTTGKLIQSNITTIDAVGGINITNGVTENLNLTIRNNATSTSGNVVANLITGGDTGGDPFIYFAVANSGQATLGIDNSNSDNFGLYRGNVPGTDPVWVTSGNNMTFSGQIVFLTAGLKMVYTEGANGVTGSATLVAGTVTVACTSVTANSRFSLTRRAQNGSTAYGVLVVTVTPGVSFTITSKDPNTPANTLIGDLATLDYSFVN